MHIENRYPEDRNVDRIHPRPSSAQVPGAGRPALCDRRTLLRGLGLGTTATAFVAAGSVGITGGVTTAHADGGAVADAPEPLDPTAFSLTLDDGEYLGLVDGLLDQAGHASVRQVMDDANLKRSPAKVIGGQAHGFVWDDTDNSDPDVEPQGITSSRDAVGTENDGRYEGRQLLAVSFYNKSPVGSRINLVDWDANHPNRYRRILLVEPTGTEEQPSFKDLTNGDGGANHVGGLVWYGDHLYVADTKNGLRIFDMSKIIRTDPTGDKDWIGERNGTFYAHNYSYALPQVGRVDAHVTEGTKPLIWSTISLDRVSESLVMTEYTCDETCDNYPQQETRAVRFPFAPDSDEFADGTEASEALLTPFHFLNGVGSHNGRWWFNNSRHKTLYYWGGSGTVTSHDWVSYGESISYWEVEDGPDLLWSLREGRGHRTVFAVEQADYTD